MLSGPRQVRIYRHTDGRRPFDDWIESLDRETGVQILKRVGRLKRGLLGDFDSVGQGVLELRIHVGLGYRVYITASHDSIVVLLGGEKSGQNRDIIKAKMYWGCYEANQEEDVAGF